MTHSLRRAKALFEAHKHAIIPALDRYRESVWRVADTPEPTKLSADMAPVSMNDMVDVYDYVLHRGEGVAYCICWRTPRGGGEVRIYG